MHPQNSAQLIKDFLQQHPFEEHPFMQLLLTRLIIALGTGGISVIIGSYTPQSSCKQQVCSALDTYCLLSQHLSLTWITLAVYQIDTCCLHSQHMLFAQSTAVVYLG